MNESSEESENEASSTFRSQRMIKTGTYWSENQPTQTQTRLRKILRERLAPVKGFRISSLREAFESFLTRNVIDKVIQ